VKRFLSFILITISLLGACNMVEPSNPFDPSTERSLQQKSIVIGHLLPPPGLLTAELSGAQIRLSSPDASIETLTVSPDSSGMFRFEPVLPGFYHLNVEQDGLFTAPRFFEVPIGSRVLIGNIPLEPTLGRVSGRVILSGRGYAMGALVAADDPAYRTAVGQDGRFTLTVPSGEREITIAFPGYETQIVSRLQVKAREELQLPGRVVLKALKGAISGQASLRQFATPSRIQRIIIELEENDSGGPPLPDGGYDSTTGDAEILRDAALLPVTDAQLAFPPPLTSIGIAVDDRQFRINRLEPGRYTLRFRADGYDSQRRPIYVNAQQTSTVGRVELSHSSTGPEAVALEGRLISGDFGLPGIVVDAVFDPGPVNLQRTQALLFDRAITDNDGNFSITAARGEYYRIRVKFPDGDEKQDVDFGPVRYVDPVGFINNEGDPPIIEIQIRDIGGGADDPGGG